MREARVSGNEVPKATIVMAATDGGIPMQHETTVVVSSRKKVINPMSRMDTMNKG